MEAPVWGSHAESHIGGRSFHPIRMFPFKVNLRPGSRGRARLAQIKSLWGPGREGPPILSSSVCQARNNRSAKHKLAQNSGEPYN